MKLFSTLRGYKKEYFTKDIFAGIVVAAMSLPISMGYAQVAGIPAVYGLYGSVLSMLVFAIFSTSRQFIFGVDATPAAIIGATLLSLGIEYESAAAMQIVPVIALLSGIWLLVFYFIRAEKVLSYISTPVMAGFISGIVFTILMMQIPKMLGHGAGKGDFFDLIMDILRAVGDINVFSCILGFVTLAILLISKKYAPKFPMAILVMIVGAIAEKAFQISQYGVKLLNPVKAGMIPFSMPDFHWMLDSDVLVTSLTVAVVIMAQTLLAENNFARKNGYEISDGMEILACSFGNIAASLCGCCSVNGSVSRSAMAVQYGGKTQAISLTASLSLMALLLWGTGFIGYLPVPVLTAIIMSALMGVLEIPLAKRLHSVNKREFFIFVGVFMGVLIFGTIKGIMIGVILSFINVVQGAAKPATCFLGILPGHEGFYSKEMNIHAKSVTNTIIYKFSGDLFFANINIFQKDIEESIQSDTKGVIVDASGMNRIDITAADMLELLYQKLEKRGIKFYLTEHTQEVNEQLRKLGLGYLIEKGMVRRTITTALGELGFEEPYPLEDMEDYSPIMTSAEEHNSMQEFIWAFGKEAQQQMEKNVQLILASINRESLQMVSEQNLGRLTHLWRKLSTFDEDELLERLELHLTEISEKLNISEEEILENIEKRRTQIAEELSLKNKKAYHRLHDYERELEKGFEKEHPRQYQHMLEMRKKKK